MHIGRVDLNLYVVFDAIYSEGSITRAASKLNLTQPAVSHALSRLREVYQDALFVRRGNRMVPTPQARSMVQSVREALLQLQTTLTSPQAFDPASTQKQVSLSMRGVAESLLLSELVVHLERLAPLMQLSSVRVQRREMESELAGGRLDFAFDVLLPVGPSIRHRALMDDRFVVVSRKRHPVLKGGLNMEKYLSLRHVLVSSRRSGPTVEDFELSRLGYHRNIGMRCQNYFVAWKTIAGSDILLTVPEQYALKNQHYYNLKRWPMPEPLPPLTSYMYWHETVEDDPANKWMREQITQVVNQQF